MSGRLSFPDLVKKTNSPVPALEIGIDYLPKKLQIGWMDHILQFTQRYVESNSITDKATIWNWGGYSQNLSHNGEPGFSMFHIVFGLPTSFLPALELHMQQKLGINNVGIKEYVLYHPDDGWTAVCHIEQGRAWETVDANEWAPVVAKSRKRVT